MQLNDDKDMKIAGDTFEDSAAEREAEDTDALTALLAQEKANGNLSRARRLGAIMADEVSAIEGDAEPAGTIDSHEADAACTGDCTSCVTQRRILLAFAVEVGLDAFLPNTLVAQTAQNVFYNSLHITAPAFYDDLQESGAFSFYYLCVRQGRQVAHKVGETYASLCGRKGDVAFAERGEALYIRFLARVRHFTDTLEFVHG